MSIAAWIMLVVHGILFFVMRTMINKRKKELQKENSILITENKQLQGKVNYFNRIMSKNE